MRILVAAMLLTILSGCAREVRVSQTAVLDRLDPLMTEHSAALAGDDVTEMRRTGRVLISTYDAGRGPVEEEGFLPRRW